MNIVTWWTKMTMLTMNENLILARMHKENPQIENLSFIEKLAEIYGIIALHKTCKKESYLIHRTETNQRYKVQFILKDDGSYDMQWDLLIFKRDSIYEVNYSR